MRGDRLLFGGRRDGEFPFHVPVDQLVYERVECLERPVFEEGQNLEHQEHHYLMAKLFHAMSPLCKSA